MKNNYIYIDSSDTKKILIKLFLNNTKKEKHFSSEGNLAKHFLKILDSLLKNNKLQISDFSKIAVNIGPGSYTSLRIGVSIANALSYSLDIPIIPIANFVDDKKLLNEFNKKRDSKKLVKKINYQHEL